jgi:peptidyl-prolyl cis-trans isomerase SurA
MMNSLLKILFSFYIFFILSFLTLNAQSYIIDRVVAVVGDFTILQSDIEQQYLQYKAQGQAIPDMKCLIFKQFLEEKLLLNQAKIDSVEISESNVEATLDQRLQYFIGQIGSQEELEAYFSKSILQIKDDFREMIRNQMLTQKMEGEITGTVKITPSEVKAFFNRINKDSIPNIDAQVELEQIVAIPKLSDDAVFAVREKLLDLRKRIMEGESFETLAILYSQDGSASNGGEIGYMAKGEVDPEYAKAAFSLKKGQVSKIVESSFGYHLIQLIDRKDDRVNTRHIIMIPKVTPEARKKAIAKLDSVLILIRSDSMNFGTAARYFSEDVNTNMNKGLLVNPQTNSSLFEMKQLESKDYLVIRDMKVGEISNPYESVGENAKVIYKIVRLKSKTDPHKANLNQDYTLLQNMALADKKQQVMEKWFRDKQADTFIHIDKSLFECEFLKKGWLDEESNK